MRRLNCIPSESAHRRGDPAKLSTAVISYAVTFDGYVVTTHFFQYVYFMRLQDLPGYSHVLSLFTCRIYPKRFRVALGLRLTWEPCPRLEPYMRFLFVRPEVCPLEDLLTSRIRLSSDSTSR